MLNTPFGTLGVVVSNCSGQVRAGDFVIAVDVEWKEVVSAPHYGAYSFSPAAMLFKPSDGRIHRILTLLDDEIEWFFFFNEDALDDVAVYIGPCVVWLSNHRINRKLRLVYL